MEPGSAMLACCHLREGQTEAHAILPQRSVRSGGGNSVETGSSMARGAAETSSCSTVMAAGRCCESQFFAPLLAAEMVQFVFLQDLEKRSHLRGTSRQIRFRAFEMFKAVRSGAVHSFSNCSPESLQMLASHCPIPLKSAGSKVGFRAEIQIKYCRTGLANQSWHMAIPCATLHFSLRRVGCRVLLKPERNEIW